MDADAVRNIAQSLSPLQKQLPSDPESLGDELSNSCAILETVVRDNPTFSSTVPIVLQRRNGQPPEPIASAVLIRIINRTFLLTAAHVTDRQEEGNLMIPGRQGFRQVSGYFSAMRLPDSGRRLDDKLDVAYYWLDSECANDLHPDCKILERPDVCLEAEPLLGMMYTFAGYPWRKTKVGKAAVEADLTTAIGTEANARDYEALGLSQSRHIAIRFNRRRTFSQRLGRVVTAGLPEGMSGGGVYSWSQEAMKKWPVRLPLVGIANGYVADRSLLIATRLHVYINCIFYNQPDLAAIAGGEGPG